MDSPPSEFNRRFNTSWANILSRHLDAYSRWPDKTRRTRSIPIFRSTTEARAVASSGGSRTEEGFDPSRNLVAHAAEGLSASGGIGHCCRIIETPVDHSCGAKPQRAGLLGAITHRHDIVERLVRQFTHALRTMLRNVDPDFSHRFDRSWVQTDRMDTSAEHLEPLASEMP